MKSIEEATREILAAFAPVGLERVSLLEALGRFSGEDLRARCELPGFDQSAMDGYAVRAADVNSAALPVIGESRAGGEPPPPLQPGSAMRIFTGAMLPEGADAVVLQENAERAGESVRLGEPPRADQNVRRRGSDLTLGELCCAAGTELGSGEIGLLASQDVASVLVHIRPRVAVVCTGDELREIGEPARPGSVVSSNAYALSAQVREAGAEPWMLPTVRDDRKSAAQAFREALGADVVVISGGVSVGDYDVVRDALEDAGISLAFWKVQMKPGRPLSFAKHGAVPVLGLPGNPVSSWVTFELLVRPGLRKMLGDPQPMRHRVAVRLSEAVRHSKGRVEFARARLVREPHGKLTAALARNQGSGSVPSLLGVDALVVLPAERDDFAAGEVVEALLLREPRGG